MRVMDPYRLYLGWALIDALARSMIYAVVGVYYVQSVGLNPLQLVLVGTVLEGTVFLFEVPTGVIADAVSRKLSIVVGVALVGLCFIIQGTLPVFAAILAAEVIRGVGETCLSGASEAWLADELGEERFPVALARAGQMGVVGGVLGIGLGPLLAATWGLRWLVTIGGVALTVVAAALAITMPERGFVPRRHGGREAWVSLGHTFASGLKQARRQPVILWLLGVSFFTGAYSEGVDRLWEAHILRGYTFPLVDRWPPVIWFGVIRAISMGASLLAGEVVVRHLAQHRPPALARVLIAVNSLISGCVLLLAFAPTFGLAAAAVVARSFLGRLHHVLYATWLNRGLPSQVRATVFSMSGQMDAFGQFVGGPFVGWIGTARSLRAALTASALILSPVAGLLAGAWRRSGAEG